MVAGGERSARRGMGSVRTETRKGLRGLVRPKLRESEGRSARTFPPTFPPLYPNRLRNRKARQRDITVFIGLLG